ncbi:MAG: hypothetical protein WCR72_17710, partial [Bacteroidota bacterium]
MLDRQKSKLNMYVLTRDFLLASSRITDKWAVFAQLFTSFTAYITEIFSIAELQDEDHTGITQSKNQLRASLMDLMQVISEKCSAYALVNDKNEFLSLVKFYKSDLLKLGDVDLISKARSLYDNVMP